jgi:hypothetical protein
MRTHLSYLSSLTRIPFHGITTDQLGNLYLADCFAGRVQKFEPIAGADPDRIAGQILRTWDTWKRP